MVLLYFATMPTSTDVAVHANESFTRNSVFFRGISNRKVRWQEKYPGRNVTKEKFSTQPSQSTHQRTRKSAKVVHAAKGCQLSGQNIKELVDFISAYRRLIFPPRGSSVYNG
jgi:hypothetical protein